MNGSSLAEFIWLSRTKSGTSKCVYACVCVWVSVCVCVCRPILWATVTLTIKPSNWHSPHHRSSSFIGWSAASDFIITWVVSLANVISFNLSILLHWSGKGTQRRVTLDIWLWSTMLSGLSHQHISTQKKVKESHVQLNVPHSTLSSQDLVSSRSGMAKNRFLVEERFQNLDKTKPRSKLAKWTTANIKWTSWNLWSPQNCN